MPEETKAATKLRIPGPVVARAQNGRWLPGVVPNPAGRPPRDQERALQSAVLALKTPGQIAARLVEYAWDRKQAVWAMPLLCRYTFSEPPKRVEVEGTVLSLVTLAEMDAARQAVAAARAALPAPRYDNEEVIEGEVVSDSVDIEST